MRESGSCLAVSYGFSWPLRVTGALPDISERGDRFAMRVFGGPREAFLQLAHRFLAEHMFDLLGIFVNVVRRDLRRVREIEFPKPMIAHDGTRELPARGSQDNDVSF